MPLVRISLLEGTSPEYRRALADGIHQALVEAIAIPQDDRFQLISEFSAENILYDPQYLNVARSDKIVIIEITMSYGRKPGQKRALYKKIVELLAKAPGVKPEDVMITLTEVAWENWSFGRGVAQYTLD